MRNAALMTAALVLLSSTPAFAGGGGGKTNATIVVTNNANGDVAVILDASAAELGAFAAAANQADLDAAFAAVGAPGKIATAGGGTATFRVTSARHTIDVGGVVFGNVAAPQVVVTTRAGQTRRINVAGDVNVALNSTLVAFLMQREVMFASFGLGGIAALGLVSFLLNRKKA